MNFKKLGNTDLKVSTICLGTMTWGEQNSQKDAFEQMDYALDQGINFFDTAELYAVPMKPKTRGKTSQIIGEWFLKTKKRNKIILFMTTAYFNLIGGLSGDMLLSSLFDSSGHKSPIDFNIFTLSFLL